MDIPTDVLFRCGLALLLFSVPVSSRKYPHEIPRGSMAAGKCRFLINEFNYYPQGSSQFLELRRACSTTPGLVKTVAMSGYLIIFISHDSQLIGECRLGSSDQTVANRRQGEMLFYTVGGSTVANVDAKIENCQFASNFGRNPLKRFPIGDNAPVAVALLYNKDPTILSGVTLEKNQEGGPVSTHIGFSMEQVIMKNLQDMYVYTSSSPYTSCKYFENFYSGYSLGGKRILRDYGQYDDDMQMALSRCKKTLFTDVVTDWEPFSSESFKLGKFTPGENNDCNTAVEFLIEDHQPVRKKPKLDFSSRYTCQITTEDIAIEELATIAEPFQYQGKLRAAIEQHRLLHPARKLVTPGQRVNVPTVTNYEDYFTAENEHSCAPNPQPVPESEFTIRLEQSAPFIWDNCDRFPYLELLDAIKSNEKNAPLKATDILKSDTCNWFEWLPSTKKFRCKLCNSLWNQQIIFDRKAHITKIISVGQGHRGSHAKYDNKKLIEKHSSSPLHLLSLNYHQLYDEGKRGTELMKTFTQPGGLFRQFTNKTENRFVSVFQSVKLDIPFRKYPEISELLEFYHVDMGKLYRNPDGNKDILMSISSTLHLEDLKYLKQERPVFSLLLDTSSDVSSQYSLAIVFQTFNKTKQVELKVYRVLHVNQRETTENLYTMLVDSLKADGLFDYFKEKCIGFSTDGGANVRKLHSVLNQISDHDLLYVYCHAHRLERAVKRAWKNEKSLDDVERLINSLYTMFNSHSPRKKLLLQQKIRENQDKRFELKPVKKIRWVNSKKRAADTVNRHWKTIVSALDSVTNDKSFPGYQQDSAEILLKKLKSPATIATLAFLSDSSTELARVSLNLQDRGGTLIAKKAKREEMKMGLNAIASKPGPVLARVLSNAIISESTSTAPVSLADFDTKPIILFGVLLESPSGSSALQATFALYIKELIEQIDQYFPPDPSDNLDVLDPLRWPIHDLDQFGNNQIKMANTGFRWNFPTDGLLMSWKNIKRQIATSSTFAEKMILRPEDFWAFYLQENIGWTEDMKTIISNIIVVPASTAHVERIYSYYTSIKTVRRYSLDVSTVEAIIRVKVNGPSTIKEFATQAHEYVKNFVLQGHMRSDDFRDQSDASSGCEPDHDAQHFDEHQLEQNEPVDSSEFDSPSDSEEQSSTTTDEIEDDDFGIAAPVLSPLI